MRVLLPLLYYSDQKDAAQELPGECPFTGLLPTPRVLHLIKVYFENCRVSIYGKLILSCR